MAEQHHTEVLEKGNIYFAYRPRVGAREAEGLKDVQRTFMILEKTGGQKVFRLIVLGKKKLPELESGGQKFWGFVDKVGHKPEEILEELDRSTYETRTRGERELEPARLAGEGVYAIVRHDDHTHLAYELELPKKRGPVQIDLNIEAEGSYIVSVKNPERPAPRGAGLGEEQKPDFPQKLQAEFHGKRFADIDPRMLDVEGAEILLIGASEDPEKDLGIKLDPQHETEDTAEIFNELRLDKSQHPIEPLIKGDWA